MKFFSVLFFILASVILTMPTNDFSLTVGARSNKVEQSTFIQDEPFVSSYFNDTDTEGWGIYLSPLVNPGSGGYGGGDNNGYLRANPPNDDRTAYYIAPSKFHGDWRGYTELRLALWSYGGTYYTSGHSIRGDIYLANNTKTAQLLFPRRPASTWDLFTVTFDNPGEWTFGGGATALDEVLTNITDFQIRAEYGVGTDYTGLDNVELFGVNGVVLDVPSFKQGLFPFTDNNPQWEQNEYDNAYLYEPRCGYSIADCGCALTSATMVLAYHGVVQDPDGYDLTPDTLNNFFKNNSWGYSWANFNWYQVDDYTVLANAIYPSQPMLLGPIREDFDPIMLRNLIDSGSPVILEVTSQETDQHWVVVKGYNGDSIYINDPINPDSSPGMPPATLEEYGYTPHRMVIYSVLNPTTELEDVSVTPDFSSILISAKAPTQVNIIDPEGHKTGYDFITANTVEEIPVSHYYYEQPLTNDTGKFIPPNSDMGVYTLYIDTPLAGEYTVEVASTTTPVYAIRIYATDREANFVAQYFSDETPPIEPKQIYFVYNPESGSSILQVQHRLFLPLLSRTD